MDTTKSFPTGVIRVSDADRDQAVAELSEHFQAGRLTQEEFEERSGQALQARTGNDLAALFTDLPGRGTVPVAPAGGPVFGVPGPGPGGLNRVGHLSMARVVILGVLAVIIVSNVLGGIAGHVGFGWLIPVVVLGSVFVRLARR
jgi:Domain of unknown function (DUF1707)